MNNNELIYDKQIPASIEQWYDRSSRSWVTTLRDQDAVEISSNYNGTKADAAASKRSFERQIEEATR